MQCHKYLCIIIVLDCTIWEYTYLELPAGSTDVPTTTINASLIWIVQLRVECQTLLLLHWSIGQVLLQFKVLPLSGCRECGLVLWGLGTWPAITATPSAHCTVKYHSSSGSPKQKGNDK